MQVKEMLAKAKTAVTVNPMVAREAMLGCFVTIHGETLKRGAHLMGKDISDEDAERFARVTMQGLMGKSWDAPTAQDLKDVKVRLDQKMNFSQAPQDLQDMHDQVCSMIVTKVR